MNRGVLPNPEGGADLATYAANAALGVLIQNWECALEHGEDIIKLVGDVDDVICHLRAYAHDAVRAARRFSVQLSIYDKDELQYSTTLKNLPTSAAAESYIGKVISSLKEAS